MARTHLWLRAETKVEEQRTPLVPEDAGLLREAGFRFSVESSPHRVFSDSLYQAQGCEIVPAGSWRQAPTDALILGLKELPSEREPLSGTHLYFAHSYKGQQGSESLLARFREGKGLLLDLEYLRDDADERLVAFGYWAGYVGAALAALTWARQQLLPHYRLPLAKLVPFESQNILFEKVQRKLARARDRMGETPSAILLGATGRSGRGASDFFNRIGIPVMAWGRRELQGRRGPFPELVDYSVLLNCVGLERPGAPFLTRSLIHDLPRQLSVINDITCDVGNPCHALPLYDRHTSFSAPVFRLEKQPLLDIISLDRLPALLPRESSSDFSAQLHPWLLQLPERSLPWRICEQFFRDRGTFGATPEETCQMSTITPMT